MENEITQIQTVLLGFQSVTKDVLEDATNAVIDMVKVMGGDLIETANKLGKALNNPLDEMVSLIRLGFVFSEQQKELVKTLEEQGDHIGAQRVILGQVQTAFART
jgi:hypothetical protein